MKVKKFLIGSIPFVLLAIIAYFTIPWLLIFGGLLLGPNPPAPEITYGEFPFRLEYEINGQRKVVHDTVICEFDGIGADEGRGKFRKWKERLASGNKNITLLKVDDTKVITFYPGSAEYYMSDLERKLRFYSEADAKENDSSFPDAFYETNSAEGLVVEDELLKEYNIKLISFDPSQPIQNSFSK